MNRAGLRDSSVHRRSSTREELHGVGAFAASFVESDREGIAKTSRDGVRIDMEPGIEERARGDGEPVQLTELGDAQFSVEYRPSFV